MMVDPRQPLKENMFHRRPVFLSAKKFKHITMDLVFYWKKLILADLGRILTQSYFIGADDRKSRSSPASP